MSTLTLTLSRLNAPTAVSQAETLAVILDLEAPQEPGQIARRVA